MPDVSGFEQLGTALGGDSELAYQQGLHLGSQTQNALAEARARVEKAKALAGLSTVLQANDTPKGLADAMAAIFTAGGSPSDFAGAQLKAQELVARGLAGNPATSPGDANALLRTVASGPVEPLYAVGAHNYANKFDNAGIQPLGDVLGGGGGDSAGIQALRAFHLLSPDGQVVPGQEKRAFDVYRTTQQLVNTGGVPGVTNANPFSGEAAPASLGAALAPPVGGGGSPPLGAALAPSGPAVTPLASVAQVASNEAQIAGAKKLADVQAEKVAALPSTLVRLQDFKTNVARLLGQPGFDTIYGLSGVIDPRNYIPGTDASNAKAALGQIDAQSFGISIQTMRGLGQLSNQEGLKVQKAFTRATDPTISAEEAKIAWAETLQHLDELERVAKIEAGQGSGAAPVQSFATEEEAAAAGLAPGARITIGGVAGTWQ